MNITFLCVFSGLVSPAIILVLIGYIGCNPVLAVCLFTLATIGNGASQAGYSANHLELASNFAGLYLLFNFLSSL